MKYKKVFAKAFPPFVDAYWIGEEVTKREFKKELLYRSTDWYPNFVEGYLRHFGEISREKILDYPIYVGVWDNEYYGVFLDAPVTEDRGIWSVPKTIKEIDQDIYCEGDRT